MQERGFTAAGFAGDRGKGALLKGEAHVLQGVDGRRRAAIGLGQIFTTDNVHIIPPLIQPKSDFALWLYHTRSILLFGDFYLTFS